jgi:hypothetical protein
MSVDAHVSDLSSNSYRQRFPLFAFVCCVVHLLVVLLLYWNMLSELEGFAKGNRANEMPCGFDNVGILSKHLLITIPYLLVLVAAPWVLLRFTKLAQANVTKIALLVSIPACFVAGMYLVHIVCWR